MRQAIRAWLKVGILEGQEFSPSEEGTPQGGVISPLLANSALHGMETALQQAYTVREGKPTLIRDADDFVVLHPSLQGVEKARTLVEHWLKGIGLELSPQKTKITHTRTRYEGHVGFDLPLANRAAVPSGQNPLWDKQEGPAPRIEDLHHSKPSKPSSGISKNWQQWCTRTARRRKRR